MVLFACPDLLSLSLMRVCDTQGIPEFILIILNTAHHCTKRHPANKIMQNHYHPTLLRSGPNAVPHILGLTASPVVRSSRDELE